MPSPIVHFHLSTPDPGATQAFLADVFGWAFGAGGPGTLASIDTGARTVVPNDIVIAGALRSAREGLPASVTLFIRVEDLDTTLARAEERGARVLVPRRDTPGGPTIAIITCPDGLPVGVVQL